MATAVESDSRGDDALAVATWTEPAEQASKADRYLAGRLAAASADFKGVALTTFFLGVCVAALAWLAVGVVLEHWLVPGGLPIWARWAWLATALLAGLAAAIRWLLPLARYRVNLVYAARAIERDHPEFHNDLVNAVLVKAKPGAATARVVRSLERRAATGLANVPVEGVIDRTPALRFAIGLAVLVALACIYEVAGPKSLLVTSARLLAPWAGLAAPSRVQVEPPRLQWRAPGDQPAAADGSRGVPVIDGVATVVRGRQLVVSTAIRGLGPREKPALVVTPLTDTGAADQAAAWRADLTTIGADGRHTAVLPDAARGLDRSVQLVVEAGDARTPPLRIAVVDAPTLLVREVRYDHPDYTRLEDETVEWQGDLRAVEGTRVTLVAECNRPLEAAWVDLDCDGKSDIRLRTGSQDLARATGSFMLRLSRDRSGPEHATYRLMFQPRAASATQREETVTESVEHRIEVLPDLAPEVSIVEPEEPVVTVPPEAPVGISVRAVDPDFGLTRVGIETRLKGAATAAETVLFRGTGRSGFGGVATIIPAKAGAVPGSMLEYRAVAIDNRPEQPNVTFSEWRALRIDSTAQPRPEPKQPPAGARDAENTATGEPSADSGSGDEPPRSNDNGEPGDSGSQGSDANDAKTNDAKTNDAKTNDAKTNDAKTNDAKTNDANDGQTGAPKTGDDAGGGDPKPRPKDGRDPSSEPQQPGSSAGQGNPAANPSASQAGKASGSGDTKPKDSSKGDPQPGSQSGAAEGSQPKDGDQGQAGSKPGQKQPSGSSQNGGGDSAGEGGTGSQGNGSQAGGGKPGSKPGTGGSDQQGNPQSGGDSTGQGTGSQPGQGGGKNPSGAGGTSSSGSGGGKQPTSPQPRSVPSDGTDDGTAMERILEHQRSEQGSSGQQGSGQQGSGQQGSGQQGSGQQGSGQQGSGQQGSGQQGSGQQGSGQQGSGQQGTKNTRERHTR
jgi:hypothetical protein